MPVFDFAKLMPDVHGQSAALHQTVLGGRAREERASKQASKKELQPVASPRGNSSAVGPAQQ
eukprot:15366480-Alexandrium_andersonii.AAC.1